MVKPIALRESDFKKAVMNFPGYDQRMLTEFFEYWSEHSEGGKKMRFEMEKTWHLGRRLGRWQRNQKQEFIKQSTPQKKVMNGEQREIDKLLEKYKQHPTSVPFSEMGKYYDELKGLNLLKTFTKGECDDLLKVYSGDKFKCRCAVVMQTMDGYVAGGITFGEILQYRKRLSNEPTSNR